MHCISTKHNDCILPLSFEARWSNNYLLGKHVWDNQGRCYQIGRHSISGRCGKDFAFRANFLPPKWDTDYRLSNKSIICDNVIRKANGVSRILKSEGGSATKYISCSIRVTYFLRRIHFELPLTSSLWVTTAQRWPIPKNEIKTITILKKGWNFSTKEKADSYFISPASIKVQVTQQRWSYCKQPLFTLEGLCSTMFVYQRGNERFQFRNWIGCMNYWSIFCDTLANQRTLELEMVMKQAC